MTAKPSCVPCSMRGDNKTTVNGRSGISSAAKSILPAEPFSAALTFVLVCAATKIAAAANSASFDPVNETFFLNDILDPPPSDAKFSLPNGLPDKHRYAQ